MSVTLSALLCEKCTFCVIIPCSPLLAKPACGMDVCQMFALPSADLCATAVFDTGRTLIFFQKQTLLYEFSSQIHHIKTENARQNRSYSHLKTLGGSYKSNLCSPVFLNIYAQKAYLYIYSVQTCPFGCIIL